MHMPKLTRRMQILLDDERYERLQRQARRNGKSIGGLIREAIDRAYPQVPESRKRAVEAILNAEPGPAIDDWSKFKREMLDEMWGKHLKDVPPPDPDVDSDDRSPLK